MVVEERQRSGLEFGIAGRQHVVALGDHHGLAMWLHQDRQSRCGGLALVSVSEWL